MGMFMRMGMDNAVRVPVLVGVDVRMDVRVRVVVLDLTCHRVFLLKSGSGDDRQRRAVSRGEAVSIYCKARPNCTRQNRKDHRACGPSLQP
jgi:hypothetical protein